jgi:hypothetical protein
MLTIHRNIFLSPRRALPLADSLLVGLLACASVFLLPQFAEIADISLVELHALFALSGAVVVFCFLYRFWPDD